MKKSRIIAAAAAALLAFSSMTATAGTIVPPPTHSSSSHTPAGIWVIFGCAGGVVLAALAANATQHRQLTWNEAASCGLLFWFTPPRRP
jgi:hypothetical protein